MNESARGAPLPIRLTSQAKRPKLVIAMMAVLVLIAFLLCVRYRRYAYAVVWHCVRGSHTEVAGKKVKLPILWWKEEDPDKYDTTLLVRASVGILPREIIVSPTMPRAVRNTDQEELAATQALISRLNQDSTANQSSVIKTSRSLVTLTPKAFNMYCEKEESTACGVRFSSFLMCDTARGRYDFSYSGQSDYVKEVESILSTLE